MAGAGHVKAYRLRRTVWGHALREVACHRWWKNRMCGRRAGWWLLAMVLCGAVIGAGVWFAARQHEVKRSVAPVDFTAVLQAWEQRIEASFPQAEETAAFLAFPRDHVGHREAPAEQWDLALHLASGEKRYAVRFRLDRLASAPVKPDRPSHWAANEFFRRFLTVTDFSAARFHASERYSRGSLGLSGYALGPPRIWLDSDVLEWTEPAGPTGEASLRVEGTSFAARLRLVPAKPLAVPDDMGFGSRRWRGYLYPRLGVSGTLTLEGQSFPVSGTGWFSHDWGRLPPTGGQIVFNRWFLQFGGGEEIALLQTRRRDGSGQPSAAGLWFGREGKPERLEPEDLTLEATGFQGPYPVVWRLALPGKQMSLTVRPVLENQEAVGVAQSWDGAVRVEGTAAGATVSGSGFMELNGY